MTQVWVNREELTTGELPPVCVRTGEPTRELVDVRIESLPDWTWFLLFFGVVPFLIAAYFAAEPVRGRLPMSVRARERRQSHRRRAWTAGAIAVGLLAVGAGARSVWPVWSALVAFAAVLGSIISLERGLPSARPDRSGLAVRLRGVHPRFAEAVEQRRPTAG